MSLSKERKQVKQAPQKLQSSQRKPLKQATKTQQSSKRKPVKQTSQKLQSSQRKPVKQAAQEEQSPPFSIDLKRTIDNAMGIKYFNVIERRIEGFILYFISAFQQ